MDAAGATVDGANAERIDSKWSVTSLVCWGKSALYSGSMTLGAERLDISQPAVSKQVRELESALGVHLFDRVGRQVRLSQAGAVLADYARRLFALAREAEEAMAEVRAVGRGRLVIGASTTIGTYLLPGVVAELWRRHPRVELLVQI